MRQALDVREAWLARLSQFLVAPQVAPVLDPGFRPSARARLEAARLIARSGASVPVSLAVEQPGGSVVVREVSVFADDHPDAPAGHALAERMLKMMLWSQGGCRIWVDGPAGLVDALQRYYREDPAGRFDSEIIGATVYGAPIEVVAAGRSDFPSSCKSSSQLGGNLDGCRIGFDLGASDRKAAAVQDGKVVFSEEILWDPSSQTDPQWHFDQIMDSLRRAAAHLPHVDAIGGSAAGIYVNNEVRVASLFRSVPPEAFEGRVRGIFGELQRTWGGIPFVVANDGEVTALAGAMFADVGAMLGLAMGSSEAAGYVTRERALTSWLNELAFAPIDYRPDAPLDEWSKDRGCGASYLSQQAVGRLLPLARIEADPASPLPERLVLLQKLMAEGDERAARVYETIGTYLGYALIEYRDSYDFQNLLLLGRVTTGPGGDIISSYARHVLDVEAPELASTIRFHSVSERQKRHGQAVAAASLPRIER